MAVTVRELEKIRRDGLKALKDDQYNLILGRHLIRCFPFLDNRRMGDLPQRRNK